MRTAVLALSSVLFFAVSAVAQDSDSTYIALKNQHTEAEETAVQSRAPVYARPASSSKKVATLSGGDSVLVYSVAKMENRPTQMLRVATREIGPLGFVQIHYFPRSVRQRWSKREVEVVESPQRRKSATYQKDPQLATLLSVIMVGGGHFYAGHRKTAAFLFGSSALAAGISAHYATKQNAREESLMAAAYVVGAWVYGIATAGEAAREANRRYSIGPKYSPSDDGMGVYISIQLR